MPAPVSDAPARDELYKRLLHHQIAWKEHTAGVGEQGATAEAAGRWYFPARRWAENLLPHFRGPVLAHLEALAIPRHAQVQHVLSSQVFALNLAAPFFAHPDKLSAFLCDDDDERVVRVEAEVAGVNNPFHEPGTRGEKRTSADLGVWIESPRGTELVLLEVKLTEGGFGRCSKGAKGGVACDSGGRQLVLGGGGGCPLTKPPYERTYWRLLNELAPLRLNLLQEPGPCPFRDHGYQLMRTQLLAAALAADPAEGLVDARFGVLVHDGNASVRAALEAWVPGGRALPWRDVVRRPQHFEVLGALGWVRFFVDDPDLGDWARAMLARYFPPPAMPQGLAPLGRVRRPPAIEPAPAAVATSLPTTGRVRFAPPPPPARPPAVRAGHREAVRWMGSPAFLELKALHDRVLGPAALHYRPAEAGVVLVSLDPDAPCSVGFRTDDDDDAHELGPTTAVLDADALAARQAAHRAWLGGLVRSSKEERAVAAWVRRALTDGLRAPGLAPAWRFVASEWRLVDERGAGQKLDLVLVNAETGDLGLIEAKESPNRRAEAVEQVEEYGRLWRRDEAELTPFFSDLIRALWSLYGVDDVACPTLSDAAPELFVAWPDAKLGLKLLAVDDM